MPKLRIDDQLVDVPLGTTILAAASQLGITIPTLCWRKELAPSGSCMVCAVRRIDNGQYLPSCAAVAVDGYLIDASGPEVQAMRRAALEMLLSDHLGECVAMCQRTCPAGMHVPRMLDEIQAGEWAKAAATVRAHLALPGVLGRVCHRPCETTCRRAAYDESVAIRRLEREAADREPLPAAIVPSHPERVAVIGAGPSGLSAAWFVAQQGYACGLFEAGAEPGGSLLADYPEADLPREVVRREVAKLRALGVSVHVHAKLDIAPDGFAAVIWATGPGEPPPEREGEFVTGRLVRPDAKLVQRVAAGREAAHAAHQWLRREVAGEAADFRSVLRRLDAQEMGEFVRGSELAPSRASEAAMTDAEAVREAARCGKCACSVAETCQLRSLAAQFGARQRRVAGGDVRFARRVDLPHLVFEPGKCILCGHCVKVAATAGEPMDLAMVGRGFTTHIGPAWSGSARPGSRATAAACVAICPTGALSLRKPGSEG